MHRCVIHDGDLACHSEPLTPFVIPSEARNLLPFGSCAGDRFLIASLLGMTGGNARLGKTRDTRIQRPDAW
jgi:hypothetical protein